MLGPVVQQMPSGSAIRQWCFVVASGGPQSFRYDQISAPGEDLADEIRRAIQLHMMKLAKPVIVHDFDDELAMAKWCETIRRCATTTDIRRAIEPERHSIRG
jgi:hypothetical protein